MNPEYAFPQSLQAGDRAQSTGGLTLRDYFAAQAMQAFVSGHIAHYGHENHWPWSGIADSAYELADAMLAERAKGGEA